MAGASAEDFARAKPVLEALGGNVVHVGGPGASHQTKVINQIIVGLTIEADAGGEERHRPTKGARGALRGLCRL
jgi:3-hydroxyisobutyrate dehydrogenase-like beta-hydroxyacid dehydrogenase